MTRIQKDDTDFEIKFYEGVLKQKGDFLQALIALGDLYTKVGLHEKGLEIDKRLSQMQPEDPFVFYNLACSYSLMGDVDQAYSAMKRAFRNGYEDFKYLESDQDLKNLLQDSRFKQYLSKVKRASVHEKK